MCLMSKKNTLLYLDEELVKAAKMADLNLSKLMESAIKTKIFPQLSGSERALLFPEDHLENLKEQDRCFEIPFRIDKVSIKNIGPFSDFETKFEDFNIITGMGATGKTTLIRSIAYACNLERTEMKNLLKDGKKNGEITVEPSQTKKLSVKLQKTKEGVEEKNPQEAMLLDNPAVKFDPKNQNRFLDFLKEKDAQIIMTMKPPYVPEKIEDSSINLITLGEEE